MAKAKGKEKLASSNVPDEMEATGDDATAETIASEPVKLEAEDLEEAKKAELESSEEEEVEEEEVEEEEKNLDEVKTDEANKDGPIDAEMTLVVPENEPAVKGDTKEVVAGDKGVENTSNKKGKRVRRRKKAASNDAGAATPKDAGKTESSAAEKDKFTGLIFMCNSKTKKDCYKYKVFGLPESKKDTVAKIHKGMRLFLYDFDLKLMYGIYKAASNGGYDIEPKAFKSAFPSQVRFTVLNDCKPLPEEKFRAAIKSNYFGRNKFNTQLSPEQVKNLCKLFTSESKTPLKQKRGVPREPISARRDQKKMPIHRFHVPHRAGPGLFVRDAYVSPPPRQLVMAPQPAAYVYDRPVDDYYYRRDPPLEHRESRVVEIRPRVPMAYERDPYSSYNQPAAYREPLYPASLSSAYAPASASAYAPASAYARPSASAYGPPPNYRY